MFDGAAAQEETLQNQLVSLVPSVDLSSQSDSEPNPDSDFYLFINLLYYIYYIYLFIFVYWPVELLVVHFQVSEKAEQILCIFRCRYKNVIIVKISIFVTISENHRFITE